MKQVAGKSAMEQTCQSLLAPASIRLASPAGFDLGKRVDVGLGKLKTSASSLETWTSEVFEVRKS